jgi:hypothetical protein
MFKRIALLVLIAQMATMHIFEGGVLVEMFKFDALIEHYHEHKMTDHHSNFADFFVVHYFGHESNDMDHKDFPCQQLHINQMIYVHQNIKLSIANPIAQIAEPQHHLLINQILIDRYESNGIWHPPSA